MTDGYLDQVTRKLVQPLRHTAGHHCPIEQIAKHGFKCMRGYMLQYHGGQWLHWRIILAWAGLRLHLDDDRLGTGTPGSRRALINRGLTWIDVLAILLAIVVPPVSGIPTSALNLDKDMPAEIYICATNGHAIASTILDRTVFLLTKDTFDAGVAWVYETMSFDIS